MTKAKGFMDPLDKYDLEKISEFEKKLDKERYSVIQEKHSQRFKKNPGRWRKP